MNSPMEGRTFTLAEAKSLLPRLEEQLLAVKTEKEVLVRSHGEIKRASANAQANGGSVVGPRYIRSEEHTSELQSPCNLVCRLLLEKKKTKARQISAIV